VGRITPVYESLGGSRLASRWQRKTIFNLLESLRGAVPECLPRACSTVSTCPTAKPPCATFISRRKARRSPVAELLNPGPPPAHL
jgi:hypothetical protein